MSPTKNAMNYQPLFANGCGFLAKDDGKDRVILGPSSNPFSWVKKLHTTIRNANSNRSNSTVMRKRCQLCKTGIKLTSFGCRCGGRFCAAHRFPEEHSCTFDFKTAGRHALAKEIILCRSDKLEQRV